MAKLVTAIVGLIGLAIMVSSSCVDHKNSYGDMTGDSVIPRGSNFVIRCSLHSTTISIRDTQYAVNASSLRFSFRNQLMGADRVRLVNGTAAELHIRDASFNDAGLYFCYVYVPEAVHNMSLVCASHLRVGLAPINIPDADFNCLSQNYSSLTCAVKAPNYHIKTAYQIDQKILPALVSPCPWKINETACNWNMTSRPPYRQHVDELYFQLTQTNDLGIKTQYFNRDHFSLVRPGLVQELKAEDVSPTSVRLNWTVPDYFDESPEADTLTPLLQYEGWVERSVDGRFGRRLPVKRLERGLVVNDLIPFTQYVFAIRSRTTRARGEHLWSDWTNTTVTTEQDVPYSSPQFVPSSYEVIKHADSRSSISLYWDPIDEAFQNAPGLQYEIKFAKVAPLAGDEEGSSTVARFEGQPAFTEPIYLNTTSYTFHNLSLDSAYLFSISARNRLGSSKTSSRIKVEAYDNLPPKPNDIVVYSYGPDGYEVQWQNMSATWFTVYWCKKEHQKSECLQTERLHHARVWPNFSSSLQGHTITEFDRTSSYNFAVSATATIGGQNISSGLNWASCIVPWKPTRLEKINDLRLVSKDSNSVRLTWRLPCAALAGLIERYEILFWKDDNKDNKQTVGTKDKEILIENLEANSRYSFELRAYPLESQKPSQESDTLSISTTSGPPPTPLQPTIVSFNYQAVFVEWIFNGSLNNIGFFKVLLNGKPSERRNASACQFDTISGNVQCSAIISKGIKPFTSYNITMQSCVIDELDRDLCSPASSTVNTKTLATNPGKMDRPHIKLLNQSSALLDWQPPAEPNGPIDQYRISIFVDGNLTSVLNVTGQQLNVTANFDCAQSRDYRFKVRAVNFGQNGEALIGRESEATLIGVCYMPHAPSVLALLGISIVGCLSIGMILFIIYITARHFKKKIDEIKRTGIELPRGLTTQPLNINGGGGDNATQLRKQMSGESSGFPYDADFEDDFKNRHGSGNSSSSNRSTARSATSGHGSAGGNSPSDGSMHCDIPLTEIKNKWNRMTSMEPTSERGDSISDNDYHHSMTGATTTNFMTQQQKRDRLMAIHNDSAETNVSDISSHASSSFVKNSNGYVVPNGSVGHSTPINTCTSNSSSNAPCLTSGGLKKTRHNSGTSSSSSSECEYYGADGRMHIDFVNSYKLPGSRECAIKFSSPQSKTPYVQNSSNSAAANVPSLSVNPPALTPGRHGYVAIVQQNCNGDLSSSSSSNSPAPAPPDVAAIGNVA